MSTLLSPTPVIDWRILPNQIIGSKGNGQSDYQHFWFTIIQILLGNVGSGGWYKMDGTIGGDPTACTCLLSCDSVTAPSSQSDTTNRLTSLSKIVMGAGTTPVHSWILLSHPTNAAGQLLFDFSAGGGTAYSQMGSTFETGIQPVGGSSGGVLYSHSGGFNIAGQYGITTRRAWAVDEVQIYNRRTGTSLVTYLANLSPSATSGDWNGKLHVMRSSDGSSTRMVFCQNELPIWFFFLEPPASPFHTNASPDHIWNVDDSPWIGACYGSSSAYSAGLYNGTSAWMTAINFVSRLASGLINPSAKAAMTLFPVVSWSQAFTDILIAANNTAANQGDSGYIPCPIGLACGTGSYVQPYAGAINDLFFIGNNLTDGASGADDGSTHSWRKFGNFLMPYAHGITALMT